MVWSPGRQPGPHVVSAQENTDRAFFWTEVSWGGWRSRWGLIFLLPISLVFIQQMLMEYAVCAGCCGSTRANRLSSQETHGLPERGQGHLAAAGENGRQCRGVWVAGLWKLRRTWNKDGYPAKLYGRADICVGL